MPEIIIVVATVVGVILIDLLVLLVMGCNLGRLGLGLKALIRVMQDEKLAEKVAPMLDPAPDDKPSGERLHVLTVLQRESRLIDFLLEDLSGFDDSQIADAVRDIQPKSQATLKKYLEIAPVIDAEEDARVDVPKGFDPSAIQVTGEFEGDPPYKCTLCHPCWIVKEIKLATPPEGQDDFVLQPAEVEIQKK